MSKVQELHQQAMYLAEQADLERLIGNTAKAQEILHQALALETEAAHLIADDITAEPTRSSLHRNAAALAIECGELEMAENLIEAAISGTPPPKIAEELKDLFICIRILLSQNEEAS